MLSLLALHMFDIGVIVYYIRLHCLCVCICECLWLPHCPLLVGDHFVTVAVGDQMANWALCHVTSLHWGLSQSVQARLLNCRPHRHHSPILTESSFRAPEGLFKSSQTAPCYHWYSIKPLAYLHSLNLRAWKRCVCMRVRLSSLQLAD